MTDERLEEMLKQNRRGFAHPVEDVETLIKEVQKYRQFLGLGIRIGKPVP